MPASNSAQQGYRSSRNIDVRGRLKRSRTGQREVILHFHSRNSVRNCGPESDYSDASVRPLEGFDS